MNVDQPRTKEEWIALHVKGMALLKSKRMEAATDLFTWAMRHIPFADQKLFFSNALAVAKIQRHEFENARHIVENSNHPVSNVLKLHISAALNDIPTAELAYTALKNVCPPNIID